MFGQAPSPQGQPSTAAPWGGLPVAQQPWSGGPQWQAAQQAPWRLSPWQTQGMPSGVAPPPQAPQTYAPPQAPPSYVPQTPMQTSASLPDFQPMQPGGGFYPGLLGPQAPAAPAPAPGPDLWQAGGQVYDTQQGARNAVTQFNNQNADAGEYMGTAERAGMRFGLPVNMGQQQRLSPMQQALQQYNATGSLSGLFQ